ncbi:ABC transporter ATP-binding protein [Nocardiopsis ansamitocini]|uniref:ABC transporter ATP-binding protein YfiL n=1 Tax=Nocardiopsis ansamitocini TaxID=1670832 RepID=A0A9W6PAL3_9ACTN|nr:ABC transporter ATP-binding protein [Nocardiopsis ansamitocini]GLU50016.1 putative ABC transporter ATP-binding protein YfiL [Nocardiopsis ansamitocini]
MPFLEVEGISKSYGSTKVVDNVSFSIAEGETYGLLGPNGAGKTTTISIIVGILQRDSGSIRINGKEHSVTDKASKAHIGFVPQQLAVYPDLSAVDNLRFFARLYGLSRADARRRSEEVLEVIGLSDRAGETVSAFSGGMARRLNIGIGLLNRPGLLILDEPTVGVDPQSRNAIFENVKKQTGEGVAVLYTTHYMEEAERLCDRVGVIDGGQIKAEGTQRELVSAVGEDDTIVLRMDGGRESAIRTLEALPETKQVSGEGSEITMLVADARAVLPQVLDSLTQTGTVLRSVEVREPDLEAVFLHLTGKALRD